MSPSTVHLLLPDGSTLCGYRARGWPVARPHDWTTDPERATCTACVAAHAERVTSRLEESSIPNVSPRGDTEVEGTMAIAALTAATGCDTEESGLAGRVLDHLASLHATRRTATEVGKHTALADCTCELARDYRELKKREGLR